MRSKKNKVVIDNADLIKRIEKEVNKEITIKVPIKGVKVELGEVDDWSWLVGILIVAALVAMGWRLRQDENVIRQLEVQKPVVIQTPTIVPTPTMTLVPTPTVRLRYRR